MYSCTPHPVVLAGEPLSRDLRLEDDGLIVDEGTLLVPPALPPTAHAPRESPPAAGLLSTLQLAALTRLCLAMAPEGLRMRLHARAPTPEPAAAPAA